MKFFHPNQRRLRFLHRPQTIRKLCPTVHSTQLFVLEHVNMVSTLSNAKLTSYTAPRQRKGLIGEPSRQNIQITSFSNIALFGFNTLAFRLLNSSMICSTNGVRSQAIARQVHRLSSKAFSPKNSFDNVLHALFFGRQTTCDVPLCSSLGSLVLIHRRTLSVRRQPYPRNATSPHR